MKRYHKFTQYRWDAIQTYWETDIYPGNMRYTKPELAKIRKNFFDKFNSDPRDPKATRPAQNWDRKHPKSQKHKIQQKTRKKH